ncbi:cysteine hydrolase, partial [Agromyces albus]
MTGLRERQLGGLSADGAALLVVDVQRSFGDPAMLEPYGLAPDAAAAVAAAVERCGELVQSARAAG